MAPRNLAYSILDVFAERPLEGNPLAVFHDARSLTTANMQALARETNLAETTFVLPADDPEDDRRGVRVRIFTTQEELPFAGHPTLGTASWLHANHPALRGEEEITLQLNVGPIIVRFAAGNASGPGAGSGGESGVVARMRQNDPIFGVVHPREAVAAALGLTADDLDPAHAPQTVSTGLPFCIVPLRSLAVARRLQIAQRDAQRYLEASDAKFFYCIAPAATLGQPGEPQWHARMQFYGGEDPATGSAAGCCAAYLVQHGLAASAEPVVLEQGVEMLRPSRITVESTLQQGKVEKVFVGGRTIPVATGSFFLP